MVVEHQTTEVQGYMSRNLFRIHLEMGTFKAVQEQTHLAMELIFLEIFLSKGGEGPLPPRFLT